jgi:glycosyltransferase involved in cell wall biosynthesis
MRRNLGRADVHLAVSPFTAQELQARLGQELRVEVLGNPLPPSPPVCTGTWEVSEVPLIGGCGRLVPLKNWKTLIKAVGILHRMGVHVRLEIVGEGPERESLKRLAVGLGIGDRVELPGNDPDWIARAQRWLAYVQPSEYESFGIAAAEAAQVGLPVLHPETGALGWTLGEAGQTYGQPKDSEGLATAILKILSEAEHESTEVLTQRRRQRQELMVARHGAEAVWDRFVRLALEKKASS